MPVRYQAAPRPDAGLPRAENFGGRPVLPVCPKDSQTQRESEGFGQPARLQTGCILLGSCTRVKANAGHGPGSAVDRMTTSVQSQASADISTFPACDGRFFSSRLRPNRPAVFVQPEESWPAHTRGSLAQITFGFYDFAVAALPPMSRPRSRRRRSPPRPPTVSGHDASPP